MVLVALFSPAQSQIKQTVLGNGLRWDCKFVALLCE